MKLNLGCGRRVKEGFINVDIYERENKLDLIYDLTKPLPFESESCEYIYSEQFIEHLDWREGLSFLFECFRCLKKGGTIRLVFPDFKTVFKKYLDGDTEFFKEWFDALNGADYDYYFRIYTNPEKVKVERVDNPPPEWHLSPRREDRKRVGLRVRYYKHLIEIVHYITHQYDSHKTLYDVESMTELLKRVGFSKVHETEHTDIDFDAQIIIETSVYMEAIK